MSKPPPNPAPSLPTGPGEELAMLRERLRAVEEHLGFGEHRVDQLHEEVRALGDRLREFGRRVELLEARSRAEKVDESEG